MRFAAAARERGIKVIIAGAGHAAYLAGVLAAHTSLPIIGVPIDSSSLQGLDSLLSTVQMPPGIPVPPWPWGRPVPATPAFSRPNCWPSENPELASRIDQFKKDMASDVERKAEKLKDYRLSPCR